MKNIWAVFRRELKSYFVTPSGYVILGAYSLIAGLGFTLQFIMYAWESQAPSAYNLPGIPDFEEHMLGPYIVFCGFLVMFIGPLVTMRLLAEERGRGTMELLLTHPLRDRDIIWGKYLASLALLAAMLLSVCVHLAIVAHFAEVEPAVLLVGMPAAFLMGAAFFAWGLFVSSVTSSQVTAGALTFGLWFVSYILGTLGEDMPEKLATPATWPAQAVWFVNRFYATLRSVVKELPLDVHAGDMAKGIVAPSDVAYYLLFIAFFIFLTFRALESRSWRA